MQLFQFVTLAFTAAIALANPVALDAIDKRSVVCTGGAVVFLVRGSDPQQTSLGTNPRYNQIPAPMTNVANAIIGKAGGNSYSQPIQYPAINPSTGQYQQSVDMGIAALQKAIVDYVNACSTGKIFAIGYSQGGQVVSGALGGSKNAGPLQARGRFTGGAVIADPTYQDNVFPVDEGSASNNGVNGVIPGDGSKYRYLNNNFSSRVRSYCEAGDQFCDSGKGSDAGTIHQRAPAVFESAYRTFLTGKI